MIVDKVISEITYSSVMKQMKCFRSKHQTNVRLAEYRDALSVDHFLEPGVRKSQYCLNMRRKSTGVACDAVELLLIYMMKSGLEEDGLSLNKGRPDS